MKELTEYEKGYTEGVIDTDGSISLYKEKRENVKRGWIPKVKMSIDNNSLETLRKIQDILDTDLKPIKKQSGTNYKVGFGKNVLEWLLPQIELIIKEKRRKIILDYIELGNNSMCKEGYNPALDNWEEHERKLKRLFERWDNIDREEDTKSINVNTNGGKEELTDYEKGFIEAVIDMDGGLYFLKEKRSRREYQRGWTPQVRLEIYNNSVSLLKKVQNILGKTRVLGNHNHRIQYGASTLRWLLPQLDLIVKKEKQEIITRYLNFARGDYNQHTDNKREYEEKLEELINQFKS